MPCDFNRIPLVKEILADLDTPLSCYLKLANGSYSYLFESVEGGEKWGRYSILGLPCRTVLKAFGPRVVIEVDGDIVETHETTDALGFVEQFKSRYRTPELPQLPRFHGGLVGYFGYDCARYIEPKLTMGEPTDILGAPDILLMVSDEVLVFDNLAGTLKLIVMVDPTQSDAYRGAQQRLNELVDAMHSTVPELPPINLQADNISEQSFQSHVGPENFAESVKKIKNYILSGDVMQVVLSQRLSMPFNAEPLNLYRSLRSLNPSPYMYFFGSRRPPNCGFQPGNPRPFRKPTSHCQANCRYSPARVERA